MNVKLINNDFSYDVFHLIKLFWIDEEIIFIEEDNEIDNKENNIECSLNSKDDHIYAKVTIGIDNREYISENKAKIHELYNIKRQKKELLKRTFIKCASNSKRVELPWGILTGIRPVKVMQELYLKGLHREKVEEILKEFFLISDEKLHLSQMVYDNEKRVLDRIEKKEIGLYISIPFCPTKCSYCSFISSAGEKVKEFIYPYVSSLIKEINYVGQQIDRKKLKIKSLYIGGGTPTSINYKLLDKVIKTVKENFYIDNDIEFTVEAGRPDTINNEHLCVLKKHGVNRISINPQTMNDEILKGIGRNHTGEDIIRAYKLAREYKFDCINMDVIAGLPNETYNMFVDSLNKIVELEPENITVHTLSIKKGSRLNTKEMENSDIKGMVEYSINKLINNKYNPYYLYRQKNILGNYENIGYTKHGNECIYNIQTMAEKHSVLALGCGGISKVIDLKTNKIDRIFNFKDVKEYIQRIDEIIERKKYALQLMLSAEVFDD